MKTKALLFVSSVLLSLQTITAQPWQQKLPQGKPTGELSIYDYKRAFDDYWAPFNVEEGYYFENGKKVKAVGWKQFHRWCWNIENQVDKETGKFPQRTALQVYDDYLIKYPGAINAESADWKPLGPTSSSGGYAGIGRLNCIAFHPVDMNTYWVGAASGGLWVTSDNGYSWACLTDNNSSLAVSDIIIVPGANDVPTIYIATGDKDHWDNHSIGVLKSNDGGTSWQTTGLHFALSEWKMVYRLLVDPGNNQVLIAATNSGVYKTTNGGLNWDHMLTPIEFIDMEYKPFNFNTLYGSTRSGEIFVSYNAGNTWNRTFNQDQGFRTELAVTQDNPAVVYAVMSNHNSGLYGIFKSGNSGSGFTRVFNGEVAGHNLLGWQSDGSDTLGQGWYDLTLAASPENDQIVLLGGINTWRSTNGGTTWTLVNHWWGDGVPAVHADKHMLRFRGGNEVFECNDGGIYYSPDFGTTWTDKTDGIMISQMYRLGVSSTHPYEVITGLQDNGTKLISGGTWQDVYGGDGMECLIDNEDFNTQYCTYVCGNLYRTTDHWETISFIKPTGAGGGAWVTPYVIDPSNHNVLYAGYADVWKTSDQGNTWTKISNISGLGLLESLAIAASDNHYLYAADYSHLWKTSNAGASWSEITGSLPVASANITSITIKNDDPEVLWVTMGGFSTAGVYESLDGGTSWTNISQGLPQIPVYTLVQNKQVSMEVHLYAGTELGVFFKRDSENWVLYNTNLPKVKVDELEIYYASDPVQSKLRAATFGRGLWESDLFYLDLLIRNSDLDPDKIEAGQSIQASCTVLNHSTSSVGSSIINYYLSEDRFLDSADVILGFSDVACLTPGEQAAISCSLTIPDTTAEGQQYILFIVDAVDQVMEYDENNNIENERIRIYPPAFPDLIVRNQNLSPSSVPAGQSTTSSCKVRNQGEAPAGPSWLNYYLSADNTYSSDDIYLASDSVMALDENDEVELEEELVIPVDIAPGDWYILFYEDPDNQIIESDEENNVKYEQLTLEPPLLPDLVIKNPSANPSTVIAGQSTNASCKVKNEGDIEAGNSLLGYYLSSDKYYSTDDQLLGTDIVNELAPGSQTDVSEVLTIPAGTSAGNWYILFYIDFDNQIIEENESNNLGNKKIHVNNACMVPEVFTYSNDVAEPKEIYDTNIQLYPNPSDGMIKIFPGDLSQNYAYISVFSCSGSIVAEFMHFLMTQNSNLNLSLLPDGLYLISINVNNVVITKKIVISR